MGVNSLMKLIAQYAPKAIVEIKLDALNGKTLLIDASLYIYKWYSIGIKYNLLTTTGKVYSHISNLVALITKLKSHNITVAFVFDGAPPVEKGPTLVARRAANGVCVPNDIFAECKQVLNMLGIAAIDAPGEAEAQIAALAKTSPDIIAVSEDTDLFAFGAPNVLRGLSVVSKSASLIQLDIVLRDFNMTYLQFIDLCILLGCDYTPSIAGIGVAKAFTYMRQFGSIEAIIANKGVAAPTCKFTTTRQLFINPLTSQANIPIAQHMDLAALEEYMLYIGISPMRIAKMISNLEKI